jgi:hypothetical protein
MRVSESPHVEAPTVVTFIAGVTAVASVMLTVSSELRDLQIAAAFAGFILLGELFRINLPGARESAPIGTAGAFGYAMLTTVAARPTADHPAQVAAVTATMMVVASVPYAVAARPMQLPAMARRFLTVAVCSVTFHGLIGSAGMATLASAQRGQRGSLLLITSVTALTAIGVDISVAATLRAGQHHVPLRVALRDEMIAGLRIGVSVAATGVLIALATRTMGLWALPVMSAPLMVTQLAFRRYSDITVTYLQTIRSLSRMSEIGGYTEPGHARRVSQLAVGVGQELGMAEGALLELEYAALMHDIGQLSLAEPIPGGATTVISPAQARRIAVRGAEVIRQTGVLEAVAEIVERQAHSYRRQHEGPDLAVPLASRIIRVANAYDDLVGDSPELARQMVALERLRLGMAFDYDPAVVDALSHVLERHR